jgi:hypothetical protein
MRRFFANPIVRNTICSVLLIAFLWGLGHELNHLAAWLDYRDSFSGFAILAAVCIGIVGISVLVATIVDARAARRPGRTMTRR